MMTADTLAIDARDLRKTYPGGRGKTPVVALDGLSFSVPAGTILGLLGPNGAGKSTAVRILATLTRPDFGMASVAGIDVAARPDQVRRAIGFVAQKPVSDPMETGTENLVLAGRLQGLSARDARARAAELLDRFALTDAAGRLVKTWSGGMARKLDVAIGLMHRPRVLFLDEPTTGLDPQARAELWAEIRRMAEGERMTVLLTTHYLDEADNLAGQLVIVDHGRAVVSGSPDELKRQLRGDSVTIEIEAAAADRAPAALARVSGLRDVGLTGRTLRARADSGGVVLPVALAALDEAGVGVVSASVARPSLDDVYLRHTGHDFASAQRGSDQAGVAA